LSFLKERQHIFLVTWPYTHKDRDKQNILFPRNNNIKVCFLKSLSFFTLGTKLGRIFRGHIVDIFPHFNARKEIDSLFSKIKPDVVVAYHWEGLASVYGIHSLPKLGIVGDPVHLPMLYRRNFERSFKSSFLTLERLKDIFIQRLAEKQKIAMKKLFEDCTMRGAFACHYAKMFTTWGIPCRYFRTPLPDPFLDGDRHRYLQQRPKILLLGHLRGIATLSGIEIFAYEIFPHLLKELGESGFEVHIVGAFFNLLPDRLKRILLHPCIKIRGHINPIGDEFLTSHLLLVPTPIDLGIRVRIITSFSFGTPVVAHIANKSGIPELEHNKNALLSDRAGELARQIIRLIQDRHLQKMLGEEGRKTYQRYFSIETAGKEIVTSVERLCG
jgi:glycosyltransferase involved in cell wall biosynthesis